MSVTDPVLADATKVVSGAPVAELRELRKTYFKPDGSVMVEALRGVDISIEHGEYVAVMGSSGSGKSTLMNVLGCLDQPTAGVYLLDGRDISVMSDEELSRYRGEKIGFVFQAFNLIPELSIHENVATPLFYQGVSKVERLSAPPRFLNESVSAVAFITDPASCRVDNNNARRSLARW